LLLGLATALAASDAPAVRLGVEGAGSPVFPAGAYIESKGNEFRNKMGFNARASLILSNWFFSYEFTALGNEAPCASGGGCMSGDYGTTKLHSFTANYHFYFLDADSTVRPYILLGIGAVFGTLGSWPTSGQEGNIFGADLRAGLGLEFPIGKHFFISLEGRYRYVLTNNPMQDLQAALVGSIFTGQSASDVFKESIQDAHIIQALLGVGVHF
jgi:hypothetical protein